MNKRISSIDIVRGQVMIIMALDHVRDLLHSQALTSSPTNLATTSPAIFFSRWITHLCAPTFVFLSGVSVYLSLKRNTVADTRRFLLKRGLWLIVLELTIINFLLWFDFQFRIFIIQVIAAIGIGFIVLSFLLKVSRKVIGIVSIFIILVFNLYFVPVSENSFINVLRNLFLIPGMQEWSKGHFILFAYPLIPWITIMMLGFSFAPVFERPLSSRNKILLYTGIGALGLFVLLRLLNTYGDLVPWSTQKKGLYTFLSFLNLTKQPPSFMFIVLFLGMAILALRYAEKLPEPVQKVIAVYGSVPMYYYLLHWILVRASLFIMVFAQGFQWNDLRFGPFQFGRPEKASGIGLLGVTAVWMAIVILLYPLCKWFSNYKRNHPEKAWLRYL